MNYLELINLILLGLNLMFFVSVNYFFRCVYKYFNTIKYKDENIQIMFKQVLEQSSLVDKEYHNMHKIITDLLGEKDA